MKVFKIVVLSLLIVFNYSCNNNSKLPNDVRWVKNSQEYEALCKQIYKQASEYIMSLNVKKGQVVVMDLDETVLDNSQYQVELHYKGDTFSMDSWARWVLREEAELVPGAKDFLDILRKKRIQIIFISNRMDERVEATKENMKKLGVYHKRDVYLLRKDKADKKDIRREEVYSGTGRMESHGKKDILAFFGDAMGDFPENDTGEHYMFPNPMYGKW